MVMMVESDGEKDCETVEGLFWRQGEKPMAASIYASIKSTKGVSYTNAFYSTTQSLQNCKVLLIGEERCLVNCTSCHSSNETIYLVYMHV